ncbi:MAG: alpha/beta fold hydrolase [Polyangiales bacterium]
MSKPLLPLFCFAHAGASASAYLRWRRRVPSWLDVTPIELAGHGRRGSEPLETTMDGVVAKLGALFARGFAQPFALFGHSFGALVAYEVALRLERLHGVSPLVVFASGAHAPSFDRSERVAQTDDALRDEMRALSGTPEAVLADPQLMELVLPVLRADYEAAARYRRGPDAKLRCPIHAVIGREDAVDADAARAWADHTRGAFALSALPGGHFYLREHEDELLALLTERLAHLHARATHATWPQVAMAGAEDVG